MKLTALSATFFLTFGFAPISLILPATAFTAAQVKQIAVKYQVQSIAVLPLANSQYLVHYNIDQPPASPASTIKLN